MFAQLHNAFHRFGKIFNKILLLTIICCNKSKKKIRRFTRQNHMQRNANVYLNMFSLGCIWRALEMLPYFSFTSKYQQPEDGVVSVMSYLGTQKVHCILHHRLHVWITQQEIVLHVLLSKKEV